jgi:hypothetical protein
MDCFKNTHNESWLYKNCDLLSQFIELSLVMALSAKECLRFSDLSDSEVSGTTSSFVERVRSWSTIALLKWVVAASPPI